MTKKAHNSLLLLTTLSVYLGLLVVGGAAPQVFAHSATTRVFEITEEIEFKDDLDLDPDKSASEVTDTDEIKCLGRKTSSDLDHRVFQYVQLPYIASIQPDSFTGRSIISDLGFDLRINRDIFSADLIPHKSSADRASLFLNELSGLSESHYSRTNTDLRKSEAGLTSFLHSNDKLLVVTSLPRAALDELLAVSAK